MKLLTLKQQGSDYLGALTDAGVFNLSAAAEGDSAFFSMQHFIEAGKPALDRAYALLASGSDFIPTQQVEWLAPLPCPAQIRDCLGFEEHLKNSYKSAIKLSSMLQLTQLKRSKNCKPVVALACLRCGTSNPFITKVIAFVWHRAAKMWCGPRTRS